MKTPEELAIEYDNNKKRKTLRGWFNNYKIKIDLEDFAHFKKYKKIYLEIIKIEQMKKDLNPNIINKIKETYSD